jgi:hypothetical protein
MRNEEIIEMLEENDLPEHFQIVAEKLRYTFH